MGSKSIAAAAVAAALIAAGCGSTTSTSTSTSDPAPTTASSLTASPSPDSVDRRVTTTAASTASPRIVTLTYSDPDAGWTYATHFPLPQQTLKVTKDISSSPPGQAKFSVTRSGTTVPELTLTTTNAGRPNGPATLLKPGTFLYDLPASKQAVADAAYGVSYGVLLTDICGTDPFAPYVADGPGNLPAQLDCPAIGTGPDVRQSPLTMLSRFDFSESVVNALVGTYTHPAYELEIPAAHNTDPTAPTNVDYCYATIRADGTVTRTQAAPPLCPNVHISVSG